MINMQTNPYEGVMVEAERLRTPWWDFFALIWCNSPQPIGCFDQPNGAFSARSFNLQPFPIGRTLTNN